MGSVGVAVGAALWMAAAPGARADWVVAPPPVVVAPHAETQVPVEVRGGWSGAPEAWSGTPEAWSGAAPRVVGPRRGQGAPVRVQGQAGGAVPAWRFGPGCAGFVDEAPGHELVVTSPVSRLRLHVERRGATLLVRGRDGRARCAVDEDGRGPVLEAPFPAGTFAVHVGLPTARARAAYALSVWDRGEAHGPDGRWDWDRDDPRWRDREPVARPWPGPWRHEAALDLLTRGRWQVRLDGRPVDVVDFHRSGRIRGSALAVRWAWEAGGVVAYDARGWVVAHLVAVRDPEGGFVLRGALERGRGGWLELTQVGVARWDAPPPRRPFRVR